MLTTASILTSLCTPKGNVITAITNIQETNKLLSVLILIDERIAGTGAWHAIKNGKMKEI